jgi:hypothetical protein
MAMTCMLLQPGDAGTRGADSGSGDCQGLRLDCDPLGSIHRRLAVHSRSVVADAGSGAQSNGRLRLAKPAVRHNEMQGHLASAAHQLFLPTLDLALTARLCRVSYAVCYAVWSGSTSKWHNVDWCC